MSNKIITFLPKVVLILSVIVCVYVPFSFWAINAEVFGKADLGVAVLFAVTFPVAINITIALALVAGALSFLYKIRALKGAGVLLISSLISVLPAAYILATGG